MGVHRQNRLPRYDGRPLSEDQMAAARLLSIGCSEFSEAVHGAGWMDGVEHEIWEWIHPTLKNSYWSKDFLAAEESWPHWFELARGLNILGETAEVWVYWDGKNADAAIHLSDWKERHAQWCERITRDGDDCFRK